MKQKILLVIPALAVLIFMGQGCDTSQAVETQKTEQQQVQETHERQVTAVPLPRLDNSLERINIKKRLETFDAPNKVSYIYLINYGRVMAFYTIKGKVTSGNKRLTSTQQQVSTHDNCGVVGASGGYNCNFVMEAPELDGSYGTSAPYIFFWDTEGVYHQWSSDYLLVDQPQQLTSQPEIVRQIK